MIHLENTASIFKATRKFHGLGQSELAATLAISQGTVSKIESAVLGPDLGLWFRFIETFKVLDPYCFQFGNLEFNNEMFINYYDKQLNLIPMYQFDHGAPCFKVRKIKPLVSLVEKAHGRSFEAFLKKNKISKEVFTILNHPLPIELIADFFGFLSEKNIFSKAILHLQLDFKSSFGKDSSLNVDELPIDDMVFRYNFSKNYYTATVDKRVLTQIRAQELQEPIINYNLLYPYYFIKSQDVIPVTIPKISKLSDKDAAWKISYAS